MHYANQAIYSLNYGLVYLSPTAITASLIKTLNVGSFPPREVMRAEHATFCMYSRASIHTEACPLRQLHGFDSMEWEGPSLPGVWYNESELAKHDLQLSQISYSKRLESETVQQTALIHLYTCSGSVSPVCRVGGWGGLMCFNVWQSEIESTQWHSSRASCASIQKSHKESGFPV